MARIAYICPIRRNWTNALAAASSFLEHTPDGLAIVVDDASPNFSLMRFESFRALAPASQIHVERYTSEGGLTRTLNHGMRLCRDLKIDHVVFGSSNVLFTPDWHESMLHHISLPGLAMLGPLTNYETRAHIVLPENILRQFPDYRPSTDPEELAMMAARVRAKNQEGYVVIGHSIPIFCQFASVPLLWSCAHNAKNVFHVGTEYRRDKGMYDLQSRMAARGLKFGICTGSYVHRLWPKSNDGRRDPDAGPPAG